MNKNRYRIIFSQARGMFIAVAEIVKSKTKQAGQSLGGGDTTINDSNVETHAFSTANFKRLNLLNFAVISFLGASIYTLPLTTIADSQIIADKAAPSSQQPTILNTSNGVTQINIQTPSAAGVSRNTYTQFDVGQEGAILNNARNNTQTQLGGWVQGNPWLAKGEAKVILNEVNSSNPSQLRGYIEVAGKQAQVVIANPSGLVCDGCGVINADRFTLTTGQAVMNQGYLESFRVREGQVTIEGKGLNGSLTPYTDVYAQALKVNAGLYANELKTVLGQNDIDVKDSAQAAVKPATTTINPNKPNFALDVGQLGGMYAGKIFLVGTEQGVGVRNAGSINSTASTLTLNANGDLINTGNIIANQDQVQIRAQNIKTTGNVSSATSQVTINSHNLDNSGLISSADELHLSQKNQLNSSGTLNAARLVIDAGSLKNNGSIEQTGTQALDLQASSISNVTGKIGLAKTSPENNTGSGNNSSGNSGSGTGGTGSENSGAINPSNPAKDGGSLEVAHDDSTLTVPKSYDTGYIHVTEQLNNDQGAVVARGGINLDSSNGLDNQAGQLNLGTIKVQGTRFNNDQGQLSVQQADIRTQILSNQSGQLTATKTLNIQSENANNQKGKIQAIEQLDLNVEKKLDNTEGQIASGQQLNIQAGQANNQSGLILSEQQGVDFKVQQDLNNTAGTIQANTQLNLKSLRLNNSSGQIQAENIQQQHDTVNNTQGSIVAQQYLNSSVNLFNNNNGQIQAQNIQLDHQQLNNSGGIYAEQNLQVTGQHLDNTGAITAGQDIALHSQNLAHQQSGLIAAGLDRQGKLGNTGNLEITAQQAELHGQVFAGQNIQVQALQQIDASLGQLQAKEIALNSQAGNISTRAATVTADQLSLSSYDLIDNQQGTLSAQDLILNANRLDNSEGHLLHTGIDQLDLNFSQSLNNQSGEIRSNAAQVNLNTALFNNHAGQLIHAGTGQLHIQTDNLQGQQGQILSNGQLQLKAGLVDLTQATTSAEQIDITALQLNHQQGQMIQRGTQSPLSLAIQQELNNQSGLIQSATALNLNSGSLNNQAGSLSSAQGQDLNLKIGGLLDNSQSGKIFAGNHAQLQVGSLNNSNQGQINVQQDIKLTSQQQIDNQSGRMVANGEVEIQSEGLDNTQGQIGSVLGGLILNAGKGALLNQSGSLQATQDIQIVADQLNSQSGLINAQNSIQVNINKGIDNSSGQIIANKAVQLNSQGLNNDLGQIGSVEDVLSIDAGQGLLSNQQGKLQSTKDLGLKALGIDNQSGLIATQAKLDLQQQWLNNDKGQIISGQSLNLIGQDLSNQGGLLQSGSDLDFKLSGKLDNSQSGQLISAGHTWIEASQLDNSQHGLINTQRDLKITTQQDINNAAGMIAANERVDIQSQGLNNNQGQIGSVAEQLNIDTGLGILLNQSGLLQSTGDLTLKVTGLNNDQGQINSLGKATISSKGDLSNDAGQIAANNQLEISSNNLSNNLGTIQSGENAGLQLKIDGVLNTQAGQINSGSDLNIDVDVLDNSQQGQISAQKTLNITTLHQLDNHTGQILANQKIQINSQGLNNDQGQIASIQSSLNIQAGQQQLSNQSGALQAKSDLKLQAYNINNAAGLISSQTKIEIESQQQLDNQRGSIVADQGLTIHSQGLNSDQGQITSAQGDVILDAGHAVLSNQAGMIVSGKDLTLIADQLDSYKGQINGQNNLEIITTKDINNESGVIAANQQLKLTSQGLNNNAGQIGSIHAGVLIDSGAGVVSNNTGLIQAQNDIQLKAKQLSSQSGTISSENGIELNIDQAIDNTAGQIVANHPIQINSEGLNNNQGQIASIKDLLSINAGTGALYNQSGSLQAAKDIQITADQLNSQSGLINAQGAIQANINKDINNSSGQIIANKAVQLISQGLNNDLGQIGSVEDVLSIDAGQGVLSNQKGKLQSTKDLSLKAQGIDNLSGLIATQAKLDLQQQWLNNNKGQMISGQSLNLAGRDFSNQGGLLQSGQDLNFKLSGKLDNSQSGQLISGGHTQIEASQLDNSQRGLINTQGDINITTQQDINNAAGSIAAKNNVQLNSQGLNNNKGQIGTEQGDLNIQTGQQALDNLAGQIQSGKTLTIKSNSLNNSGVISALDTLELQSQNKIDNDLGQIASNAQLNMTANQLSNQSGVIQTDDQANLTLSLSGVLNNQSGQIHSGADQQITAQQIDNSAQGQITAQGALNIQSQSNINNQTGQLIANGQVQLKGQGVNNNQGQIGSLQDQLIIDAGQGLFSNQSGNAQAKKDLTVTAQWMDNQQGQINSQSKIELVSQQYINNLEGLIAADLGLKLNSLGLNNNQGQIGSAQGDVVLIAGNAAVSNQAGTIVSGKDLTLTADQLDNSYKGQINSQNNLEIITTKDINNGSGVIAANQQLKLNSQGLNNSVGQIGTLQGNLLIDTGSQLLNNQQGVIQSSQDLHLNATGLDNTQGQISSKQQLQLDSGGQLLNNHQGTLSAENLKIDSGKLDNNQGLIQAQQSIQIDTHQQDLINTHSGQKGGILSQGDIQLNNIQTLNNSQGYLASGKQLDLQANQVLNQQGTLLATTQLNLQGTGQNSLLNNQSGQLLSMGGMTLNIDKINNNGKINASDADSHIMAAGELNITTQQLDNQNTLNTDPANPSIQGIDAQTLKINSNILNNQTGAIRSSGDQTLNISQELNNQSGQISSEKQLTILGNQLAINNLDGQLLAGMGLNLTAKSLSGDGKVLSLGNATLILQNDYVHNANAQLQANQDLSFSTLGNIVNNGTLNSGNQLELNAANIVNNQDGKIESHETRLSAQNSLNNTGLINGDYTRLQANTLNNEGTGRIYGTTLAIQANTLNNRPNSAGVAPVIASRGDMHLGVQTLNNLANTIDYNSQALILSGANLYLGGALDVNDQAVGQAQVINNESATIESLGDMSLSAKHINNINKNFSTDEFQTDYQEKNEKETSIGAGNPMGGGTFSITKYIYHSETTYRDIVKSSAPSNITAGGNLDLMGAVGVNDKSYIIAGKTIFNDGSIKNLGATGVEKTVIKRKEEMNYNGLYTVLIGEWEDTQLKSTFDLNVGRKIDNQLINSNNHSFIDVSDGTSNQKIQSSQLEYTDISDLLLVNNSIKVDYSPEVQDQNLTVADAGNASNNTNTQTVQQNQPSQQSEDLNANVVGSKVNVSQANLATDQNQVITDSVQASNTSQVNTANQNLPSQQYKDFNIIVEQNTQQQGSNVDQTNAKATMDHANAPDQALDGTDYEIRTITSSEVRVPNSALYKVNTDSNAGYLIETDPNFSNYKNWLSSDYMLDALSLDPALQQKRLADGFYEQRMVQDQIANLTGYRFLEGYASDDEQYKALMNNGVSFAKLYGLRPGIALTAAQAAQLTSDIVWLVEKTVTLPNGSTTKALVPQVYVKARVGDLKGDGTLISGNSVNFKLDGDLINGATIAGRQAVQITADNVQNLNGRIQGNQVNIETRKDLNNVGGQIIAKDAMALKVGGNLNIETTIRTSDAQVGNFSSSITNLDRIAGIYVGNGSQNKLNPNQATLVMNVAGNTTLKGAQIKNSNGSTLLNTLGNVDIGSVSIGKQEKLKIDDKNGYQLKQQQDVGSQVNSLGSLSITGQNITGKAVNLNSQQGNLQLSAQKDIILENGLNQSSISSQSQRKGSFGGKKSSTYEASNTTSIANQLNAGQNLILNSAQGNITATHLQAAAGNNLQIQAQQGNVTLLSAIDDKRESSTSSKKGAATYNNHQTGFIDQEVAQTTLKAGNTVDINAAKNIELQANDIQAANNIYVGNTLMQRQADGSLKAADGSLMPERVTLSTLATKDEQWDEQQKGYRGIAKELIKTLAIGAVGIGIDDPVKIGESKGESNEQIRQQGTSLQANNIAIGSSGQTTLTSTDLSAKNINLSGQKVTLNAAEEQTKQTNSQGEETVQGLGVKLNNDSIRLGGFKTVDTTQSTTTTITTHKVGQIDTENLSIQGTDGIDILGQNVKATGDTVLDHGRGELNIGGYENKTVTEDKTHVETVTVEVGVRNAYVDAALAVVALKDAVKNLSDAKKDYRQAEKDYAAGKITKDALNDSKANMAMATANVAAAEIAVAASAAAAAVAASTSYGTGFTIGANGERIETTTATTTTEGHWQGSNLDLNNLILKSEGQNANIQGSRITATGTTTFDGTKDLNVTAGTEHNSQTSNSKTNSQSVSYTYGGGGSASIGKQTSKSESNSLTNVNSEVNLNKTEGSLNSLNIKGGVVSIQDRGNLQVNNIHVESLQDTASSSNSSRGGSIGGGYGSGSKNITASYTQSKGSGDSAWVNNTSKLLIGDENHDANLDAMGVKNITNIGGVIANATKNADGTLTDHSQLNYTGNLELKDLQDHNYNSSSGFNVSTNIGIPQGGTQAASIAPKGSTTIGLNSSGQETEQLTKATMGQGTVTNDTASNNRDINNTQEITRDQTTGMLDGSVTVDHRLLSESGRAEIIQQQKELPENGVQIAKNIVTQLPEGQYKTDALNTLSHLQVKAAVTPTGFKKVGDEILEQYAKFIEQGNDPKIFRAMADQPETLKLLQDAYTLEKELHQFKQQLISQGLDEEDANAEIHQRLLERHDQANVNSTTATPSNISPQTEVSSLKPDGQSRIDVGTLETQNLQASIFALPNAKTDTAKIGGEDISVVNDSNLAIDTLTRIGQLKQNFDTVVDSTGIDKEKASLVVNMLLGGVAGTVKSLVQDKLIGDKVAAVQDRLTKEGVALVHGTDYETVQQVSQRDQLGNDTAEQLSNQLELTGEGINLSSGILLGTISLGSKGTTTKTIDGKEVEVSIAGEKLGGAHKDTSKPVNDGFDSHHCPAKNCYKDAPISSSDGPAIKMEPADHKKTASWGSSDDAIEYRAKQQELLNQGKLNEAMQMDIDDIRSKFGNKYDNAIKEMVEYTKTLNPNDFKSIGPK